MSDPPQKTERQATTAEVRVLGGFFMVGGAALFYFGKGWYADGLIPVDWFGILVFALGVALMVFPKRFAKRAGRISGLGEQLAGMRPPKE